jgi:hypothetical protein
VEQLEGLLFEGQLRAGAYFPSVAEFFTGGNLMGFDRVRIAAPIQQYNTLRELAPHGIAFGMRRKARRYYRSRAVAVLHERDSARLKSIELCVDL